MKTNTDIIKTIFLGVSAVAIIGLGTWGFNEFSRTGSAQASAAEAAAAQEPAAGGSDSETKSADSITPSNVPDKPWLERCSKEPKHCEIVQRLLVKESGQRFAEFAIGYPEGKGEARGVLILPLGILLEKGVQIKVDENPAFNVNVRYCAPQGCMAFLNMREELIAQMKGGTSALISFQNAQGQTLNMPITLKGFTEAVNALKAS